MMYYSHGLSKRQSLMTECPSAIRTALAGILQACHKTYTLAKTWIYFGVWEQAQRRKGM